MDGARAAGALVDGPRAGSALVEAGETILTPPALVEFHVKGFVGGGRTVGGGGLIKSLAAFLADGVVNAAPKPINAAGDGEVVPQDADLLLETGQIAEFPFQLLLLGLEPFQFRQEKLFVALGGVEFLLGGLRFEYSRLVMESRRRLDSLSKSVFWPSNSQDPLVPLGQGGGGGGDGVLGGLGISLRLVVVGEWRESWPGRRPDHWST